MNLRDQQREKIRLEERFRREIRVLFYRIRTEFTIGVAVGRMTRADKYGVQFAALLQNHYSRVQRSFRGLVKNDTKEADSNAELLAALVLWAELQAAQMAGEMVNTTQGNIDSAVEQARQSLSDDGTTDYSARELATVAAVILARKFKGRENTIIITETQKAAESTKLIEAFSASNADPRSAFSGGFNLEPQRPQPKIESMKSWEDVGDKDVRPGHRAAQVAAVPIDKPFMVNGERLMYPGDNSLGASAGNTINCRCGTVYTIG